MSLTTSQEILDLWAKNESLKAKEERLAINSLRRDVETAQESIHDAIVHDAIGRYRKQKLRARSKAKANAADVFSELDQYSSMEDIRNAYGYEIITEHEMDRLMNLWELREQAPGREGPYTDRVVEMLELASRAIWAKYGPDIMEYDSKVSQMRQAAEQIAAENYRRDIEREHHAERGE